MHKDHLFSLQLSPQYHFSIIHLNKQQKYPQNPNNNRILIKILWVESFNKHLRVPKIVLFHFLTPPNNNQVKAYLQT
jgi:hypothetical protein